MNAADALAAVRAAGIEILVDGDDLVLEANSEPSADLLDLLTGLKADLISILRSKPHDWSMEDWKALFDECAGIAEFEGDFTRSDAEFIAFEECVERWLATDELHAGQGGVCLQCACPLDQRGAGVIPVTSTGSYAG